MRLGGRASVYLGGNPYILHFFSAFIIPHLFKSFIFIFGYTDMLAEIPSRTHGFLSHFRVFTFSDVMQLGGWASVHLGENPSILN